MELRVRALETILVEKGYVEAEALDRIVEAHETRIGPHIGAQIVARAWSDPAFKLALLDDATKAAGAIAGQSGVGDHLVAVENTPERHNIVVCTLCSCYPWDVLGLPPVWYKSAAYRSRTVKEPRAVLADFGVALPPRPRSASGIPPPRRAFSSCRCVPPVPMAGARTSSRRWSRATDDRHRPAETARRACLMDGIHDMGGMDGFGKVEPEPDEPVFHESWEGRVLAMSRVMGGAGDWNIDMGRYGIEVLPPDIYLTSSYYKKWFLRLEACSFSAASSTPTRSRRRARCALARH